MLWYYVNYFRALGKLLCNQEVLRYILELFICDINYAHVCNVN